MINSNDDVALTSQIPRLGTIEAADNSKTGVVKNQWEVSSILLAAQLLKIAVLHGKLGKGVIGEAELSGRLAIVRRDGGAHIRQCLLWTRILAHVYG